MTPGALCAFQFLRNQGTPSGSEAFRPLCLSLYVPLEVKKPWKLDRKLILDINRGYTLYGLQMSFYLGNYSYIDPGSYHYILFLIRVLIAFVKAVIVLALLGPLHPESEV